ncbi:D-aminoacylase [Candidatus Acetothermia bacterium]|nr:D-aminoacylase [Candidatus Acetothermia bacterium]MCI2427911.1 D-aminoacylase [Candidatus Acetothermia bacterium]MCI2428020.1 D-aminoacylase [Candidatus Acetothermia bacterium]
MMFDIIITGGQVFDGSGAPPRRVDIGINRDRIKTVRKLETTAAVEVIDATGLAVAPGFIDMHSHSDFPLLVNPQAESKIRQGVTTEVIGQCGASAAPVKEETLHLLKEQMDLEALALEWDWLSMGDYLTRLQRQGIALNVVPLIGHGTIRAAVMGFNNRAPTQVELAAMKELIVQAMEEGAWGLSTGLIYPPSSYADTEELIELSKVVAECGGIYSSHIRGEGKTLLDAVSEAIRIGKEAGIAVQLAHHKATGKENWGKVVQSLELIDRARANGLDVTADQYPYIAASNALSASLPGWMHVDGKVGLLKRLRDPAVRQRLRHEMVKPDGYWNDIQIAYCKINKDYEGMRLQELADRQGNDPYNTLFDLLIAEEATVGIVNFAMSETDVRFVMKHSAVMIGSDGSALATYGVLHRGKPHPRSYGTFPRVLGKYAREEKVLAMEEAIRKMTALPAEKLGLYDRGRIAEKMQADIVIFNPQTVRDNADYINPHRYPAGIEYVLVNGTIVIANGQHTNKLAGRVLTHN